MKSENAIVKFALFVILVTVLTSCLVSNTYAKYTTNVEAADTAIVAKWNVSAEEISQNFSIFDVSSIYDTKNADYTGNGVRETDVKTGTTNGIIAPGTWGKFSFTLENTSEVNALYSIDYTVDEAGVYLLWSVDEGATWTDDLADVTDAQLNINSDNSVTVFWKWAYETEADGQTDVTDTALGNSTTDVKPNITIKATFTQID